MVTDDVGGMGSFKYIRLFFWKLSLVGLISWAGLPKSLYIRKVPSHELAHLAFATISSKSSGHQ